MKQILLFLAITSSILASSQTIRVPVFKDSASVISVLSKGGVLTPFSDVAALPDDSLHTWTLARVKKVIPTPPPTVDTVLNVRTVSTKFGTESMVHNLTSVPAGALILVMTTHAGSGKSATVSSSQSLTFINQSDADQGNSGDAEVYSAIATTSGNLNVTIAWPANSFQTSVVYVVTGGKIGAKAKATAQAAPSVSLTTTKANSLLLMVTSDYNGRDGSTRAYRDAAVNRFYNRALDKSGTAYYYTKQTTTVKSYTEGISSPSTQASGTIVIELTGSPAQTIPDTEAPTVPSLTNSATSSTSIALTWSGANDNIGVVGYDIYVNNMLNTTTTQRTYTLTGLVASTQYIVFIRAKDAAGNTSQSNTITVTTSAVQPPNTSPGIIEGFGANAVGGSNSSTVYRVTNLNQSGAGSLANGIGSNKTIVFDVDGTITARLDLIGISYLTIDATGRDITINGNNNGDAISFDGSNTHHCILKNVKVTNAGNDGINVLDGAHDIAITNCVSYGNRDGNIDVAGGRNVTVQYCILGGGASGWSGAMLITAENVSVHHNLFSPATSGDVGERNPLVHSNYTDPGNPCADIRNNVIWRYGRSNGTGSGYGTAICYNATANVINNYYYAGNSAYAESATNTDDGYGAGATGKAYVAGNVSGNGNVNINDINNHAIYNVPAVTTQTACASAWIVLQKAGTDKPNKIQTDLVAAVSLPGCPAQ